MLRSMLFGDICKQHLPMEKGKLSEWSKEPHSKCGVRITSYRGFESLTFRKQNMRPVCPSLLEQAGLLFWLHRMPPAGIRVFEVGGA